jgi:hypothetical protein
MSKIGGRLQTSPQQSVTLCGLFYGHLFAVKQLQLFYRAIAQALALQAYIAFA